MRRSFSVACLLLSMAFGHAAPSFAAKILVVRKGSPDFSEVLAGIASATQHAHQISDYVEDAEPSYADFARRVRADKPDLLVLMDNKAVNFAMRFNQEPDAYARGLRAVATMGLNLKKVLRGDRSIAGVAYEVPALSVVTQFRYLTGAAMRRILVVYRKQEFVDTIQDATTQLRREGIELVAVDADGALDGDLKEFLDDNLSDTVAGQKIDAVLVLSDNALLTPETFGPVWVEKARQLKIPFLCGLEKFAAKDLDFCAFASSPDHRDLGHQVAEMIFAVLDDHRPPSEIGVEYILSVKQTVNLDKLRALGLHVRPERMSGISVSK